MEELATAHPTARDCFTRLRDDAAALVAKDRVDPLDLDDWIVLNGVVGDDQRTLEWFDRIRHDRRHSPLLEHVSFRIERLLVEQGRWKDYGELIGDPIAKLRFEVHALNSRPKFKAQQTGRMDEDLRANMEELPLRLFRENISKVYAGLLAAGREAEAQKFADEGRKADQSPKMVAALVERALQAGEPRLLHIEWLKADDFPGRRGLLRRLEEVLR
jgi:hypothetical protein